MTDRHTPNQRRYNMQQVKSKNTKPEILLRKSLFSKGFRYFINYKNLPGKPDLVIKKYNTVIFMNGCFWHGHENCKSFTIPKTRTEFWTKKIDNNILRDKKNENLLSEMGWNILTVWECQLTKQNIDKTINFIANQLRDNIE